MLFTYVDNKRIELNIKSNKTKYNYKKMLDKIEKEIKLINNNIDKMYIDKLNNIISSQMYERLLNKLTQDVKNKENEYIQLKKEADEFIDENNEKLEKNIKNFLKLEKPTPEIMKMLINRIEIHQDKQVDLIFNFKMSNMKT